jgi:hypothetical protein
MTIIILTDNSICAILVTYLEIGGISVSDILYCKVCEAVFTEYDINSTIENINDTIRHMTPHHKTHCFYCDNPLYTTKENSEEFKNKYFSNHEFNMDTRLDWFNLVRSMYLSENPLHNIELQQKRILQETKEREAYDKQWKDFCEVDNKKQAEQKKREEDNNRVRCPRCGSFQINLLRKKWSWLTGFFTSDVDRICMSCKHKF